jgi:hypothetical protein
MMRIGIPHRKLSFGNERQEYGPIVAQSEHAGVGVPQYKVI